MMLVIENRGSMPLAFKISTTLSSGELACGKMFYPAHNAIALLPYSSTVRSECTFKKGRSLHVEKVETMQLPMLGYYYLSSLKVAEVFGARHLLGHQPPL